MSYAGQTEIATTSQLVKLLDRTLSTSIAGAFLHDEWRLTPRLVVSPGARLAHFPLAETTVIDPRVGATYQATSQFRWSGGWSVNHQGVSRITREDRTHGDGAFWMLADGTDVSVSASQQVVATGTIEVPQVRFDVEAFCRHATDLTTFAPRLYPGVAPTGTRSQYFHHGSGTSRGVEVRLVHDVERSHLWFGYMLSRAEYEFPTLEAQTFAAGQDQLHQFKAGDTFNVTRDLRVTALWVVASGRPYTPATGVEEVWFPNGAVVRQGVFAAKNSARLIPYSRLDVSTEYRVRLRRLQAAVGMSLFNLYDRKNVWYIDNEVAGSTLTTHDVPLAGRALNVFVRIGS